MFKTIYGIIFVGAFIIGLVSFSTAAAMVFTKPGISENLLIKISNVLNPGTYSASIWDTTGFYIPSKTK